MAQLEVPDKYAAELKELALRDERSVQDVVSEAMDAYLSFRFTEARLTSAQLERLKASLEQVERGELISEAQVEAFFDDWEMEASVR